MQSANDQPSAHGEKRKPGSSVGAGVKKARKAEIAKVRARVAAANRDFPSTPAEEHVVKCGQVVRLQVFGPLERTSLLFSWVAALVEDNMREMYEKC